MFFTRPRGFLAAVACLLLPALAHAAPPDDWVAALAGDDEPARSLARQYLHREGAAVVPRVVPLLRDPRPAVSWAAYNVLADIAGDVAVPGREAERAAVTDALVPLLAAQESASLKINALKLLTVVAAPDRSLEPIAALLADRDLRERARYALEEIGSPSAIAALVVRLQQDAAADPDFACALLNSLARVRSRESLPTVAGLLQSGNPKVRAAAVRALAWTGDPAYLEPARAVLASADDATRSDAGDALLRLLDALARDEAHRAAAVAVYQDLLKTGQGTVRDGALAGLGRHADAASVAPILAAARDRSVSARRAALSALRALPGAESTTALVAQYGAQPPDFQLALLPVLAARADARVVPLLAAAAASPDVAAATAALRALGTTGLLEATEPLTKMLSNETADVARESLLTLADGLARRPQHRDAAGRAYAAVFESAPAAAKAVRRRAVAGFTANPVPEALHAVQAVASDPELKALAIPAQLAVAGALTAAGRKPEALALYEAVRAANPGPEVIPQLARGLTAAGAATDANVLLGFVTRWWLVGPFELGENNANWNVDLLASEPNVNLVARYMSGKRRVQWKPVETDDPRGVVDLRKHLANRDNCIGYAYTEITVDEPTDALLLLGVDDSERLWVNGESVFELFTPRGLTPDQDRVPVKLKQGVNRILLKLYQNSLGWEFCLRVTHPDGRPLAFRQKAD